MARIKHILGDIEEAAKDPQILLISPFVEGG